MPQSNYTAHISPFGSKRRRPVCAWILALAVAPGFLGTASAQLPNARCVKCHDQIEIVLLPIEFSCGDQAIPYVDHDVYSQSAHAELACTECHRNSHPEFTGEIGPRAFPSRREYVRQIQTACLDCHEFAAEAGGDHAAVVGHAVYESGSDVDGPLCSDCHPAHATPRGASTAAAGLEMAETKSWNRLFATKGIEYLMVLGFCAVFVPFAVLLYRAVERAEPALEPQPAVGRASSSWFEVPDGFHLHRGHTWARAQEDGVFKVGMDDFSRRLIGEPSAVMLPPPGERLHQGERGWRVGVNDHILDLLSPVDGEVVEINQQAINAPSVVSDDPYGEGWLMKVRPRKPRTATTNLLSGRLARAWYDEVEEEVGGLIQGCSGAVLQDGGVPISGFARELAGEQWSELVAKFLLTELPSQPDAGR